MLHKLLVGARVFGLLLGILTVVCVQYYVVSRVRSYSRRLPLLLRGASRVGFMVEVLTVAGTYSFARFAGENLWHSGLVVTSPEGGTNEEPWSDYEDLEVAGPRATTCLNSRLQDRRWF